MTNKKLISYIDDFVNTAKRIPIPSMVIEHHDLHRMDTADKVRLYTYCRNLISDQGMKQRLEKAIVLYEIERIDLELALLQEQLEEK